ncbi:hypothetical protein [Streptomyces sp. NPDC005969]|uniref:hypothetical protein n=1 Tax=Streptomyces sp. NPDC005969 TaxID=3156722 RepID=UPI0033F427A8
MITDASLATDVPALASMLRDDVRCSMPPTPGLYVGRDAVVNDWVESGFEGMKGLRGVLTSVNRQPAVAFYLWRKREGAYLPLTIDVVRVTGGAITEIVIFHDDQFPRLGLPERLPADGTVPVSTLALRGGARVAVVAAEWCDAFGVVTRGRVQLELHVGEPGLFD